MEASARTQSGPYQTQSGPHQTQNGPYQTHKGLHQTQSGPHQTQSGSYQTQGGPHQTQSRPYQTHSGPHQTQSGSYQTQGGPHQTQSGSYQTHSGPHQTQSGSYQTHSGPHQTHSGPHQTQSGSYQTQSGPHQTQGGPYQTQGGPHQTQSGSYQTQSGPHQTQGGPYQTQGGLYQTQGELYQSQVGQASQHSKAATQHSDRNGNQMTPNTTLLLCDVATADIQPQSGYFIPQNGAHRSGQTLDWQTARALQLTVSSLQVPAGGRSNNYHQGTFTQDNAAMQASCVNVQSGNNEPQQALHQNSLNRPNPSPPNRIQHNPLYLLQGFISNYNQQVPIQGKQPVVTQDASVNCVPPNGLQCGDAENASYQNVNRIPVNTLPTLPAPATSVQHTQMSPAGTPTTTYSQQITHNNSNGYIIDGFQRGVLPHATAPSQLTSEAPPPYYPVQKDLSSNRHSSEAPPPDRPVQKGYYVIVSEDKSGKGFKVDDIVFLGHNADKNGISKGLQRCSSNDIRQREQCHRSSGKTSLQRHGQQSLPQTPASSSKLKDNSNHTSPGNAGQKAIAIVKPLSQTNNKDVYSDMSSGQCKRTTTTDESGSVCEVTSIVKPFVDHIAKSTSLTQRQKSVNGNVSLEMSTEEGADTMTNHDTGQSETLPNYLHAEEVESQPSGRMQATPTSHQPVTTEVPSSQSEAMGETKRQDEPIVEFDLSSVPLNPWTNDKLRRLIELLENRYDKNIHSYFLKKGLQAFIPDVANKIFSMFWEATYVNVLMEIDSHVKLINEVKEFCSKHVASDSVILSYSDKLIKNCYTLKHDAVHRENTYKSSWLNTNEQLDDIDKEFDFAWSVTYGLTTLERDEQQNEGVSPTEITALCDDDDLEKQASSARDGLNQTPVPLENATADSIDSTYSFKIDVLPPEEARALFEKLNTEQVNTEKTEDHSEMIMNLEDDLPEMASVRLGAVKLNSEQLNTEKTDDHSEMFMNVEDDLPEIASVRLGAVKLNSEQLNTEKTEDHSEIIMNMEDDLPEMASVRLGAVKLKLNSEQVNTEKTEDHSEMIMNMEDDLPEMASVRLAAVKLNTEQVNTEKMEDHSEMIMNVEDDLPEMVSVRLGEVKLENKVQAPIQEFCCTMRWMEVMRGSNTPSLCNCQSRREQSADGVTAKSCEEERDVQMETFHVMKLIKLDPTMESKNKVDIGNAMDKQTLTPTWMKECDNLLDLTEEDEILYSQTNMEPKRILQLPPSVDSNVIVREIDDFFSCTETELSILNSYSELEMDYGQFEQKCPGPTETQFKTLTFQKEVSLDSQLTSTEKMNQVTFSSSPSLAQNNFCIPHPKNKRSLKARRMHKRRAETPDSLPFLKKIKVSLDPNSLPAPEDDMTPVDQPLNGNGNIDDLEPVHSKAVTVKLALFGSSPQKKHGTVINGQRSSNSHSISSRKNFYLIGTPQPPTTVSVTVGYRLKGPTELTPIGGSRVMKSPDKRGISEEPSETGPKSDSPVEQPMLEGPSKTGPLFHSTIKQQIYEEWRNRFVQTKRKSRGRVMTLKKRSFRRVRPEITKPRPPTITEELPVVSEGQSPPGTDKTKQTRSAQRETFLNLLRQRVEKSKTCGVRPKKPADTEISKYELGNPALMPLQGNNVLRFNVLPKTFNFNHGPGDPEESTDPQLDIPDPDEVNSKDPKLTAKRSKDIPDPDEVNSKDPKLTAKRSKGAWAPDPPKKYTPLPSLNSPVLKTSTIFQQFQKKYKEKQKPSED